MKKKRDTVDSDICEFAQDFINHVRGLVRQEDAMRLEDYFSGLSSGMQLLLANRVNLFLTTGIRITGKKMIDLRMEQIIGLFPQTVIDKIRILWRKRQKPRMIGSLYLVNEYYN